MMAYLIRSFLLSLCCIVPSKCVWIQTFNEDFDGSFLSSDLWNIADNYTHGDIESEAQLYVSSAVSLENGLLVLTTSVDQGTTLLYGHPDYKYVSGWVDTGRAEAKWSQQFGRFEVRARLPTANAAMIWPAIWMMPDPAQTHPAQLCWPAAGEIDIMEMWGKGENSSITSPTQSTYHYTSMGGSEPTECGSAYNLQDKFASAPADVDGSDWAEDFHTWRLDWNATTMQVFLDESTIGAISSDVVPPATPFYWIFNTAICSSGNWCGVPGASPDAQLPVRFEIDYVRAWAWDEEEPV
jgi:beta-glucanase (GH16 family)